MVIPIVGTSFLHDCTNDGDHQLLFLRVSPLQLPLVGDH